MSLKEKLVSSFMAFENTLDVDSPVHDIEQKLSRLLKLKGFRQGEKKIGNTHR